MQGHQAASGNLIDQIAVYWNCLLNATASKCDCFQPLHSDSGSLKETACSQE